jgi:hypothetical protein
MAQSQVKDQNPPITGFASISNPEISKEPAHGDSWDPENDASNVPVSESGSPMASMRQDKQDSKFLNSFSMAASKKVLTDDEGEERRKPLNDQVKAKHEESEPDGLSLDVEDDKPVQ